jgi:adenosylcobinamide-phosphate synthase
VNARLVVASALGIELALGDPVSRWHPVALFGQAAEAAIRRAPAGEPWPRLLYGAGMVLLGVGGVAASSAMLLRGAQRLHPLVGILAAATLLKASLSYRQLEDEALAVADLLDQKRFAEAARSLRALVSRDTSALPPELLVSATVESIAENLSDSVVAPLFYFALCGVPGALAYRVINTLDAMIGYHGACENLGKVAARLDDVVNLVPARLTTVLLGLAACVVREDGHGAATTALAEHGRTESPNAGWPMAAMAGALGVRLEKVGHYRLGVDRMRLKPSTIRRAVRIARVAAVGAAILTFVAAGRPGGGGRS